MSTAYSTCIENATSAVPRYNNVPVYTLTLYCLQ